MGSVVFSSTYATSGFNSATYNVRITYSESYDSASNKTTLNITKVELQKEGNAYNYGAIPFFGSVKVNGTTLLSMNGGASVRVSLNGGSYCTVNIPSSISTAIQHEDDGTKTVTFEVVGGASYGGHSFFCGWYNNKTPFGVYAQSKSVALTSHPRASSIASCPSSVNTQGTFELTVSRNSSAFYHKATLKIGGTTMYTSDAFATQMSYTIPRSWFSSHPSDASLTVTVSVQTYSDSSCTTTVGSPVTRTFTLNADAGMKPSVSAGWVSISAYNTGSAAENIVGFVKGYSKAAVTFDSSNIDLSDTEGASIASYTVTCQGESVSASPYRTPVLTQNSLVCTITDSRGRTASETFTVTLMDYAPPALTGIQIFRCDNLGVADEDGAYYTAKATLTYSSLNSQNVCPIIAYRKAAGGSYSSDGYLVSGQFPVSPPYVAAISVDTTYSIKISATDSLGNTAEYFVTIPTRKWAMKFRSDGNGVAFGKAAETDATFEVTPDWAVKFGQPLPVSSGGTGANNAADARTNLGISGGSALDAYPVGSIYMSVNSTSPASLFGGTWTQIEDTFLLAAGQTYTAGDTGGEATHTLIESEMPAHSHKLYGGNDSGMPDYLGGSSANYGITTSGSQYPNRMTSAGSSQPHNNMPPYLVVYMWQRVS